MSKLTYAAVLIPILLVATVTAHAGDGRALHSSRPVSPHAGLVSYGAIIVTPHPVVVAQPPAFVGPRVFVGVGVGAPFRRPAYTDRKSTRLNSSHLGISYAVFCLKKKKKLINQHRLHINYYTAIIR